MNLTTINGLSLKYVSDAKRVTIANLFFKVRYIYLLNNHSVFIPWHGWQDFDIWEPEEDSGWNQRKVKWIHRKLEIEITDPFRDICTVLWRNVEWRLKELAGGSANVKSDFWESEERINDEQFQKPEA